MNFPFTCLQHFIDFSTFLSLGDGRVLQWCWINLGRPANLDYSRARASVLEVGAGGGCLGFFLSYIIFLLSHALWETI